MSRRRGSGNGCLLNVKLPRGEYLGRYYVYLTDAHGKERRIAKDKRINREVAIDAGLTLEYDGPLTKTDAREVVRRLQRQARIEAGLVPSEVTFGTLALEYLALAKSGWDENTRRVCVPLIQQHLGGVRPTDKKGKPKPWKWPASIATKRVADLDWPTLQTWLNGYIELNASASLLKKIRRFTRATLDLAKERRLVFDNPATKLKAKSRATPNERALTLDECRKILATLDGRDRLIFQMLMELGLLGQEIFALRANDIGDEFIRIDETLVEFKRQVKGGAKTEARRARIFVPPVLMASLRNYASVFAGNDLLFRDDDGRPLSHNGYLRYVLQPKAEAAGVEGVTYQALRRTCATLFGHRSDAVSDTQAHLRHSDPATTLRYYEKPIPESVKSAVRTLEADLLTGISAGTEKSI